MPPTSTDLAPDADLIRRTRAENLPEPHAPAARDAIRAKLATQPQ